MFIYCSYCVWRAEVTVDEESVDGDGNVLNVFEIDKVYGYSDYIFTCGLRCKHHNRKKKLNSFMQVPKWSGTL